MSRTKNDKYTKEHLDFIQDKITARNSMSQVAAAFNNKFTKKITRCSIAGLINRKAIVRPAKIYVPKKPKKLKKPSFIRNNKVKRSYKVNKKFNISIIDDYIFDDVGNSLDLLDLKSNSCRWPTSSNKSKHKFCGLPMEEGHHAYCKKHHKEGILFFKHNK